MMAKDWRSDFAAVEAEATELVEALEGLQKESGRYREINETLEGSSAAMEDASRELGSFVMKVDGFLIRMQELGIPEIREQLDRQQKTLATLGTSLTTTAGELRKSLQRQMVVTIVGIVLLALLIYALPF